MYIYVYSICMHMLRYYESLKMCKECICVLNDKVKDLNEFINVF